MSISLFHSVARTILSYQLKPLMPKLAFEDAEAHLYRVAPELVGEIKDWLVT